jgi:LCP family protein required for cell wall assembly
MAEERNPNDPKYDWLYSGTGPRDGSTDPEETQLIRRDEAAGADETQQIPRGAPDGSPEETQLIRRHNPDAVQGDDHTRVLRSQPPPAAEEGRPASFGGTYEAPKSEQPRYAEPAAPRRQPAATPPRDSSGSRPPTRSRGSRRRWWLRGLLALVVLWLLYLVLVPIYAWSKITQVDAEPDGNRPDDAPGTTYLLVGSDSREDLSKAEQKQLGTGDAAGNRTDTILMLHVTDGDGPNLLLSIPRDSYVEIPGHGENKINAAYSMGGPDLLVETVEQASGVRVDDYIEIGFDGFVDIIDAVGGIEVCPEQAINDKKAALKLAKGCQEVDGSTALGYSRSRAFALGDITRAQHQREVIAGVGHEAASWQTFVLPWRYWQVNMAAADSLHVGENVGPIDLARFAWAMRSSGGSGTTRCVVPYSDLGATTSAGSSVIWDEEKAGALFDAIRADDMTRISCTEH